MIDFREFMFGVYVMSSGPLEEKLEWCFRLFDRNNDGSVSKTEMLEIITVSQTKTKSLIYILNYSNSKRINSSK